MNFADQAAIVQIVTVTATPPTTLFFNIVAFI
jgi:hypothetical protein